MKPENDCRQSEVGKRVAAHPWIYRLSYHWQNILGVFGYAWHNRFADECTHDFACCKHKIAEVDWEKFGQTELTPKCDGDHGAPACLDPGCWQNTPPPSREIHGTDAMILSAGSSNFLVAADPRGVPIMLPDVKPGDPVPTTTWETWMPEARQAAAQCWCDPSTDHIVMHERLCEAVAKRIAAWMETAAQGYRDAEFYRGIVVQIGTPFGVAARTSDDGSIQQDVLVLRVPELVEKLRKNCATAEANFLRNERYANQLYSCLREGRSLPDEMKTTGLGSQVQHLLNSLAYLRAHLALSEIAPRNELPK